MARSYISYKKQISELGKEDNVLLEKLILEAINAISYNASKTLDKKHGDGTILNEITQSIKKFKSKWEKMTPDTSEYKIQQTAINLLQNLGYKFISREENLKLRGGKTSEVLFRENFNPKAWRDKRLWV